MQRPTLNVSDREGRGKGPARAMRREGSIPCVVYRKGTSKAISVNRKELSQFLKSTAGRQTILSLKFAGGGEKPALIKEFQSDPVMGDILHVDFYEVSLTEKVRLMVRVKAVGEPIGVKQDGGILQHILRDIEIECLPDNISERVEIDVSGIGIGQSVHVSDIDLGEDIKILTDPKDVIATVIAPVIEEVPVEEEEEAIEGEEAVEGEEGAEGEEAKKEKEEPGKEGEEKKKKKKKKKEEKS